jgi:putative NIF3 family GTP cyclohydrolase 1 type 2
MIKSVAVCAGSGSSVLRGVPADVYLTGEMGHHEVLAAIASNTHVILCEHTNTEVCCT